MRSFLVIWNNNGTDDSEIVDLSEGQKANQKTFAEIIDDGLNHYHGYSCDESDIKCWSLIED